MNPVYIMIHRGRIRRTTITITSPMRMSRMVLCLTFLCLMFPVSTSLFGPSTNTIPRGITTIDLIPVELINTYNPVVTSTGVNDSLHLVHFLIQQLENVVRNLPVSSTGQLQAQLAEQLDSSSADNLRSQLLISDRVELSRRLDRIQDRLWTRLGFSTVEFKEVKDPLVLAAKTKVKSKGKSSKSSSAASDGGSDREDTTARDIEESTEETESFTGRGKPSKSSMEESISTGGPSSGTEEGTSTEVPSSSTSSSSTASASTRSSELKSSTSVKGRSSTPKEVISAVATFLATNIGCIMGVAICLVIVGLSAGLVMALVNLDSWDMEMLLQTNTNEGAHSDPVHIQKKRELELEQKHALKILPLVNDHHRLLMTLLLVNFIAAESLPLLLDGMVNPANGMMDSNINTTGCSTPVFGNVDHSTTPAFPKPLTLFLSVVCMLVFGEIIPSLVFTGTNQLEIAAFYSPLVGMLELCTGFLIVPLARLLDKFLGKDHKGRYNKAELKALVSLQIEQPGLPVFMNSSGLIQEEVRMVQGAMDLSRKTVAECVLDLQKVYMLSSDSILDINTMAEILGKRHSRVPIYEGHPHNIRGFLTVKNLIVLNPADRRRIKTLGLEKPLLVHLDYPLLDLLTQFQQGRSHIALVSDRPDLVRRAWSIEEPLPPNVHIVGIVTLEDVIETLIKDDRADASEGSNDYGMRTEPLNAYISGVNATSGDINSASGLHGVMDGVAESVPRYKANYLNATSDHGNSNAYDGGNPIAMPGTVSRSNSMMPTSFNLDPLMESRGSTLQLSKSEPLWQHEIDQLTGVEDDRYTVKFNNLAYSNSSGRLDIPSEDFNKLESSQKHSQKYYTPGIHPEDRGYSGINPKSSVRDQLSYVSNKVRGASQVSDLGELAKNLLPEQDQNFNINRNRNQNQSVNSLANYGLTPRTGNSIPNGRHVLNAAQQNMMQRNDLTQRNPESVVSSQDPLGNSLNSMKSVGNLRVFPNMISRTSFGTASSISRTESQADSVVREFRFLSGENGSVDDGASLPSSHRDQVSQSRSSQESFESYLGGPYLQSTKLQNTNNKLFPSGLQDKFSMYNQARSSNNGVNKSPVSGTSAEIMQRRNSNYLSGINPSQKQNPTTTSNSMIGNSTGRGGRSRTGSVVYSDLLMNKPVKGVGSSSAVVNPGTGFEHQGFHQQVSQEQGFQHAQRQHGFQQVQQASSRAEQARPTSTMAEQGLPMGQGGVSPVNGVGPRKAVEYFRGAFGNSGYNRVPNSSYENSQQGSSNGQGGKSNGMGNFGSGEPRGMSDTSRGTMGGDSRGMSDASGTRSIQSSSGLGSIPVIHQNSGYTNSSMTSSVDGYPPGYETASPFSRSPMQSPFSERGQYQQMGPYNQNQRANNQKKAERMNANINPTSKSASSDVRPSSHPGNSQGLYTASNPSQRSHIHTNPSQKSLGNNSRGDYSRGNSQGNYYSGIPSQSSRNNDVQRGQDYTQRNPNTSSTTYLHTYEETEKSSSAPSEEMPPQMDKDTKTALAEMLMRTLPGGGKAPNIDNLDTLADFPDDEASDDFMSSNYSSTQVNSRTKSSKGSSLWAGEGDTGGGQNRDAAGQNDGSVSEVGQTGGSSGNSRKRSTEEQTLSRGQAANKADTRPIQTSQPC